MGKIVDDLLKKRNGNYVHALEVNDVLELETCIEELTQEFVFSGYTSSKDILEFFETISIYPLNDEFFDDVTNFNISNFVKQILDIEGV